MRAKMSPAVIVVAIAVSCMLLFVLTPTQPEHIPYTAISKEDLTTRGLRSLLERWNIEIKARLRWLGLLSRSGGYTASW